jgi:hypothetical protein
MVTVTLDREIVPTRLESRWALHIAFIKTSNTIRSQVEVQITSAARQVERNRALHTSTGQLHRAGTLRATAIHALPCCLRDNARRVPYAKFCGRWRSTLWMSFVSNRDALVATASCARVSQPLGAVEVARAT